VLSKSRHSCLWHQLRILTGTFKTRPAIVDISSMKNSDVRQCLSCGKGFTGPHNKRYCSASCAAPNYAYLKPDPSGACRGTVGSIYELIICADLLKRKCEVFRSVSQHSSCDLIALKNGKCFRVEVTKGVIKPNGTWYWSKHDPTKYDLLALVAPQGQICYQPEAP